MNVADNVALSLDLDMNDFLCKNLKYPDDSEVVGLPAKSSYYSREMEDDHAYVWAGFAKPGKHTVMIDDPLNLDGPIKITFLVGVRSKNLPKMVAPVVETWQEI